MDFANKILMPWEELRTGPSSADKTLLLDYISPLLPIGLWMAIRNRHWAVVMSIFGQLLIMGTVCLPRGPLPPCSCSCVLIHAARPSFQLVCSS